MGIEKKKNKASSERLGILDKHEYRYRRNSIELLNMVWLPTNTTKNRVIPHKILGNLWEMISTDLLIINNYYFFCVAGIQSKF